MFVGPLAVTLRDRRHVVRAAPSGKATDRAATSTAAQSRRRPRLRFLAFGLAVVLGRERAVGAALRHPGGRNDAVHARSRPRTRTVTRGDALHARPHLRPSRARRSSPTPPPTASRSDRRTCPESRRAEVVQHARRAGRHGPDRTSTSPSTRIPVHATTLVRVAQDVEPEVAGVPRRVGTAQLPGVEVVVETRRNYELGRACLPTSLATRARSAARSSPS